MEFVNDCIGPAAQDAVKMVHGAGGGVVLLENLRFHPEEEKNDPGFAAALASLADLYVNDAFGAAHRAHASVEGITHHMPRAAAGLLMEQELRYLGHALESPERPFVAILGGAKVSDKLEVIQNMLAKVDRLLVGGAMAYTFFKARGLPVGQSLVEDDKIESREDDRSRGAPARRLVRAAGRSRRHRQDPGGHGERSARGRRRADRRPPGRRHRPGDDQGLRNARSPTRRPSSGTDRWASSRSKRSRPAPTPWRARSPSVKGTTIIGGGDSIAAVRKAGIADRITHISTGGGASLEFLGGRTLPGVAALRTSRAAAMPKHLRARCQTCCRELKK